MIYFHNVILSFSSISCLNFANSVEKIISDTHLPSGGRGLAAPPDNGWKKVLFEKLWESAPDGVEQRSLADVVHVMGPPWPWPAEQRIILTRSLRRWNFTLTMSTTAGWGLGLVAHAWCSTEMSVLVSFRPKWNLASEIGVRRSWNSINVRGQEVLVWPHSVLMSSPACLLNSIVHRDGHFK